MTPVCDRLTGEQLGWWKCDLESVIADVCAPGETLVGRDDVRLHGQPCGVHDLWGRQVVMMNYGDFRSAVSSCDRVVEDHGGLKYKDRIMATPRRRRANRNGVWLLSRWGCLGLRRYAFRPRFGLTMRGRYLASLSARAAALRAGFVDIIVLRVPARDRVI